jgi:hypothetical protein
MAISPDRRSFMQSSAALGAGGLAFLRGLPAVSAADAKPEPSLVRLDSGIEPLVVLLEETPREKLLEEVGARIKKGLAYRDLLTALLLAGVRNIQPRPSVGFKFHAVLVINSAHQAALAAPDNERWLPLFWALDSFKSAQATNIKESGWRMKPVNEMTVPKVSKAREAFAAAMDAWDIEAADAAAAALARCDGPGEAFDLFARYGCRDFRDIGHKAIFVANAFRTLEVIGWQHAEPVLRSLAYAMLKYDGESPAKKPQAADLPGIRNAETAAKMKAKSPQNADPKAAWNLLTATRSDSEAELCDRVVGLIGEGTPPKAIWSGLLLAGAELLMRQPGITSLHSLTSLNALRYASSATSDPILRNLLLLQATAFVPLFRDAMKSRGKVGEAKIDDLRPQRTDVAYSAGTAFEKLTKNKLEAATIALTYISGNPSGAKDLTDAARRLIFLKGTDAHDYKFSSAVIEDSSFLAPEMRDRFLAASLFWLKGSDAPDSPLVQRTRAALA